MNSEEKFVENMVTALTDDRVMNALALAIEKLTAQSLQQVNERIDTIHVEEKTLKEITGLTK